MIQRRLAWPLCKDDRQIREAFHIFCRKNSSVFQRRDVNITVTWNSGRWIRSLSRSQNKSDFSETNKQKNICASENTIKRMKRQPTEWGGGGGLHWRPVAKTLSSQCRGPGFEPWSGNYIPHASTKSRMPLLKISLTATKTQCSQTNKHKKKRMGGDIFTSYIR